MTTNYESIVSYYGGTDAKTLREYATQCLAHDGVNGNDPDRAMKLIRLAEEMERGVVFLSSTEGGKLHYRRSA